MLPHLKIMRDRVALTNEAIDSWMEETEEFVVDFQDFVQAGPPDAALVELASATDLTSCAFRQANDIRAIDQKTEREAGRHTELETKLLEYYTTGVELMVAIPRLETIVADLQARLDMKDLAAQEDFDLYSGVLATNRMSLETLNKLLIRTHENKIDTHYHYLEKKLAFVRQVQAWRANALCEQPCIGAYADAPPRERRQTSLPPLALR